MQLKTSQGRSNSYQALNAIGCTDVPEVTEKKQIQKLFQNFAGRTKYTLRTAFDGDISYIPMSPINRMERFILWTPDHTSKVATVWVHVASGLVQYSFNPSRITDEGRLQLDALLQVTLAEGYVSLYRYGRVSMAEYAVDVEGLAISDVVLVDAGRRRYTLTKEGTTYCGCRRSVLVGVTYDKGAEIRTRNPAFAPKLLRYELRMRATELTVEQWVKTDWEENPFNHFFPVPRASLRSLVGKVRAEKIRNFGLRAVFLNVAARNALCIDLHKCKYEWADPDLLWSNFKSHILSSFRPWEMKTPSIAP